MPFHLHCCRRRSLDRGKSSGVFRSADQPTLSLIGTLTTFVPLCGKCSIANVATANERVNSGGGVDGPPPASDVRTIVENQAVGLGRRRFATAPVPEDHALIAQNRELRRVSESTQVEEPPLAESLTGFVYVPLTDSSRRLRDG